MIEENIAVTVIVLTYNNYAGICDTVHSILMQDYPEIEIIISDDGTPNGSVEQIWKVIGNLTEENKQRINIIYQTENLGTVAHANKVASISRGMYIKFLPPGDRFCSYRSLSTLVETMKVTKTHIVTSPALVQNSITGKVVYQFPNKYRLKKMVNHSPQDVFETIARANIISAVGTIYHKEFFKDGGFDCSYKFLDDWPTWLRTLRENKTIGVLNIPTVYYAMDGISNKSGTAFESKLLHDDMLLCYEKEIIPYQNEMGLITRWFIGYYYGKLLGRNDILFKFYYGPILVFYNVKKFLKKLMFTK